MMPLYVRRMMNRMYYKAKKSYLFSKILFLIFSAFIVLAFYFYNGNFKPILKQLSISKASAIGQNIINKAVEEIMARDEIVQNKLVNMEKDENGQVSAVTANYAVMNHLKSEIAISIQDNLYNVENSKIYIPIGNLTGIEVLSNFGPRIQVNMIPFGKAKVDFESNFTQAGINQTRLQILVSVALDIGLLLPNSTSADTQVITTIPMSETIIVGNVPDSYTNIESSPDEIKGDILDTQ